MNHTDEYELISHMHLADCSMFLVDILYRPLHLHKELELCYVLDGEATVSNKSGQFAVKAGDIVLFDSGRAHEIFGANNGIRLLAMQISKQFCRRYCPQISNVRFDACLVTPFFSDEGLQSFQKTFLDAFRTYCKDDIASLFECMSLVSLLFSNLLKHVPYHLLNSTEYASKAKSEERLNRILLYLEIHFREPIRLADLAEQENLTETYLSHFLKDQLHVGFQEYLSSLRLEAAMYLLNSTDMTLTDISYECGFSDPKYMNRYFLKRIGMHPQAWRNSSQDPVRQIRKSSPYTLQHILTQSEVQEQLALLDKTGIEKKRN